MSSRKLSTVSKILAYQFLISIIISSGFLIFKGYNHALSCILGGVAAFIPNLFFAIVVNKSTVRSARKVLNSFYIGEAGKQILLMITPEGEVGI